MPQSFRTFMTDIINNIYTAQTATLLPVTVIAALWLGSEIISFDHLWIKLRIQDSGDTWLFHTATLGYVLHPAFCPVDRSGLLILFVFGNQLYLHITKIFPLLTHILLPIISFRSTAGFFVMLLFFTGMYVLIPKSPAAWLCAGICSIRRDHRQSDPPKTRAVCQPASGCPHRNYRMVGIFLSLFPSM